MEAGITSFSKFYKQLIATKSYEILYLEHQHTWENLIQESELLTPRRNGRAALDTVGIMTHALFGVLDSDDTEQMAQTIANVKQNEDYSHLLLRNLTSVINSTINMIKQGENNMNLRFSELKTSIYNELNTVKDETRCSRTLKSR